MPPPHGMLAEVAALRLVLASNLRAQRTSDDASRTRPGLDWRCDYLQARGVNVVRTDAAVAFVEMMRARGLDARRLGGRGDRSRG
jgi:hypothetical protein